MPTAASRQTGYTKHFKRVFEPVEDGESGVIIIEDDDIPPVRVTKRVAHVPNAEETIKRALEYFEPRHQPEESQRGSGSEDSEDRDARLGGHPSKPRADAVSIPDPMANQPFTQRGGALRPVNTLYGSKGTSTTKAQFYNQKVSRGTHNPSPRKDDNFRTGSDFRENNHNQPIKKPRTGSSPPPGDSKHRPIQLNDSQEPVSSSTKSPVLTLSDRPKQKKQALKSKHVQRLSGDLIVCKALGKFSTETAVKPGSPQTVRTKQQQIEKYRTSTPTQEDSEDGEKFMKGAKAQRRQQEREDLLNSSSPKGREPSQDEGLPDVHVLDRDSDEVSHALGLNATSKMPGVKHYDECESPDELSTTETIAHDVQATLRKSHALPKGDNSSMQTPSGHQVDKPALKRDTPRPNRRRGEFAEYRLRQFRYGTLPQTGNYSLVVNANPPTFEIAYGDNHLNDDPVVPPIALQKLYRCLRSIDGAFLSLNWSKSSNLEYQMFLEFESEKDRNSFEFLLRDHDGHIRIFDRERHACEKWFINQVAVIDNVKRPGALPQESSTDLFTTSSTASKERPSARRSRLVDNLDSPTEVGDGNKPSTRNKGALDVAKVNLVDAPQERSPGTQTSVRTRLRTRKSDVDRKDHPPARAKPKFSSTGGLGPQWSSPLTYPKSGKKREIVDFEDLWRLDDDEFLNDSIVGLFMRYLEAKLEGRNAELAKRVYFFNSYFFESLNKNTKGATKVNYDAVSKWTRGVSLFDHDFVVVPINENFHWYMAIICNLPYFMRDSSVNVEDGNGIEKHNDQAQSPAKPYVDDGSRSSTQPGQDDDGEATEGTRESFVELSLSDHQKASDVAEDVSENVSASSIKQENHTTNSRSRSKHRPKKRALAKYDTAKPAILILDSLGSPRPSTISALKQYVVREAEEKEKRIIDSSDMRGMNVPQIPQQKNFSDCGLYVAMYLEQFVADPTSFVQRILQRQDTQGWPKVINGHNLRNRLRHLILELHKQQEDQKSDFTIPEVGRILIDPVEVEEVDIDTTDSPRQKRQKLQDAHAWYQELTKQTPETAESSPKAPLLQQVTKAVETASTRDMEKPYESIVIDDESQTQLLDDSQHDSPLELAAMLSRSRSQIRDVGRPQQAKLENEEMVPHDHSNETALSQLSAAEGNHGSDAVPETQNDEMLV